jgi:Na+-driven multidrug efflux pump
VALSLPFLAVSGVLASVMVSVGAARRLARAGMFVGVGLSIGLAWVLGVWAGWGLAGVFLVDAGMTVVRSVHSVRAIRRPRWTRAAPAPWIDDLEV